MSYRASCSARPTTAGTVFSSIQGTRPPPRSTLFPYTTLFRSLGMAKGLPLGPLQRLMPWAILGFVINLTTGFMFFAGDPFQYIHNVAFGMKLLFIGLAGVNVIVFYVSGLYRHVDNVGAGQDVPVAAKLIAAASLFLWVGVMYWGRMLPFIGNAF